MQSILVLFPNQLFRDITAERVVLLEEPLFFTQFKFHKQKLAFHRASMKWYCDWLTTKGVQTELIRFDAPSADVRTFIQENSSHKLIFIDPVDDWLSRRIHAKCKQYQVDFEVLESPQFILSDAEVRDYFKGRKRYFQTEFYIHFRKKLGFLLEDDGTPTAGKWSFDEENRLKYPKGKQPPFTQQASTNSYIEEAEASVLKDFPENPGEFHRYPISYDGAEQWLEDFLKHRLIGFGDFEDAMVDGERILHHSVLSPLINAGLLDPRFVLNRIIEYANQHSVPINNTEGILRQILGWREFIRAVYILEGRKQRCSNYFEHHRPMPEFFYTGKTNILPIKDALNKVFKTAYNHHIERLMLLSNFMLLCEVEPDAVYQWFSEFYIDAYDWVMVPNVYGMGQFSDGGLMCTKPYISGSNYVRKMSNYAVGDWVKVWDAMYWNFIYFKQNLISKNFRMIQIVKTYERLSDEKKQLHLSVAKMFLTNYHV